MANLPPPAALRNYVLGEIKYSTALCRHDTRQPELSLRSKQSHIHVYNINSLHCAIHCLSQLYLVLFLTLT